MLRWLLGRLKKCVQIALRLIWWLFLALIPLHILVFTRGLFDGAFHSEQLSRWIAPSFQNILLPECHNVDYPDDITASPAGVPKLSSATCWWKQLGLTRTEHHSYNSITSGVNGLLRKVDPESAEKNWDHWVYVSSYQPGDDDTLHEEWERAFVEILDDDEYNLQDKFHYLSCQHQQLCDLLLVKNPTLLYFTTATTAGKNAEKTPANHQRVVVNVLELPTTARELGLSSKATVKMSPLEHFKVLIKYPTLATRFPLHDPFSQLSRRFGELEGLKSKEYPGSYGRVTEAEKKLLEVVPNLSWYLDSYLGHVPYWLGWVTTFVPRIVWSLAGWIHGLFLQATEVVRERE